MRLPLWGLWLWRVMVGFAAGSAYGAFFGGRWTFHMACWWCLWFFVGNLALDFLGWFFLDQPFGWNEGRRR